MFQQIRLAIYNYLLQSQLKKQQQKHEFVSFSDAKKIGVLFDITEEENIPIISQYVQQLEKQQKKVKLLGFVDASAANESLMFSSFSRKNTNFFFVPKGNIVETFMEQHFDILICAFLTDSPSLEYISTLSEAKFRVGPHLANKEYCFDLMMNHDNDSIKDFLDKLHPYLNMFSPKTTQ
ncbi:MAG: DUF6913 domain-containing protein [Chitinophagales bacterium]